MLLVHRTSGLKKKNNHNLEAKEEKNHRITWGICQASGISNLEAAKICKYRYRNDAHGWTLVEMSEDVGIHKERDFENDLFRRIDEANTNVFAVSCGRSFHGRGGRTQSRWEKWRRTTIVKKWMTKNDISV